MVKKFFVEELKKIVKRVNESLVNESLVHESFQEIMMTITDSYLQAYQNKDFETMNQMLYEQRKLRKELTIELRNCQVQSIISAGKVVQTYNIFNKIAQIENEKKSFGQEMDIIIQSYRHAREVLVYLYKHRHVQHKKLKEEFDIAASTLSDLLEVLTETDCVERLKNGKYSFYNLTNEGRKYVKDTIKGVDDEVIVDADIFKGNSRSIIKKKQYFVDKCMSMTSCCRTEVNPEWISGGKWEWKGRELVK